MIPHLTERERSIIPLLARGLTARHIGSQLGMSEHTVKRHLRNLYRLYNVHTAIELLMLLIRAEVFNVHTGKLKLP